MPANESGLILTKNKNLVKLNKSLHGLNSSFKNDIIGFNGKASVYCAILYQILMKLEKNKTIKRIDKLLKNSQPEFFKKQNL